jgi:hypothetical protein
MLLLGFGHKAKHGKDLAAVAIRDFYGVRNQLLKKHGYGGELPKAEVFKPTSVGIFKFASALYTEVNDAIEYDHGNVHNVFERYNTPSWVTAEPDPDFTELAPYGKHPKLLQWWGTEYRRAQDPDYWVQKMYEGIPPTVDVALVTDVRFPNEADSITQRGGYTVKVERLNPDGSAFVCPDRFAFHPSETSLDNYNWKFYLKTPDGHAALTCENAITLAEYLRGLHAAQKK